jgi:ketosteroid isomerase-like protein
MPGTHFATIRSSTDHAREDRTMEPADVVHALWDRIQARDWTGVADLVAEDAVVEWPVSAERIVGRDNYVAVNREYPEGWSINVLGVVADGDQVVSEVEVPHVDLGTFRVASFWTVSGNRIVRGTEYWTSVGADEAPRWRAGYVEPIT